MSLVPIPLQVIALREEQGRLFDYPVESLAGIIREVGFSCNLCARCCTRSFNGHVFLLDHDVRAAREIDPGSIEPAPDPEFCDQDGILYVSGYALRARGDEQGSCWFLEQGRCRVYGRRFSICRIYPYMLHREADEWGDVDWRQISGLGQHGTYHQTIPEAESLEIARETKEYENAILTHQIAFLECIQEYFSFHHLRHVQKIRDDQLRRLKRGEPVRTRVYYSGNFEDWQ